MESDRRRQRAAWYSYDVGNTIIELAIGLHLTQWFIVDLGISSLLFGLAFGLSYWAVGFTGPALGRLGDTFHLREPLFVCFTVAAIVLVASFTAIPSVLVWRQTFAPVCLVVAILASYCFQIANILYNAELKTVSEDVDTVSVSAMGTALSFSGALVGMLTIQVLVFGVAGDREVGRQQVFAWAGAFFIVFAAPALLQNLRRFQNRRRFDTQTAGALTFSRIMMDPLAPWRWVRRDRRLSLFVGGFWFLNGAFVGTSLYLPVYLRLVSQLSENALAGVLGLMVCAVAVGAVITGKSEALRRDGLRRLAACIVLWAATLVGAALLGGSVLGIVLVVVQGVFAGAGISLARGIFAEMTPAGEQGTAFGVYGAVQRLSGGAGSILWPVAALLRGGEAASEVRAALVVMGLASLAGVVLFRKAAASQELVKEP